MLVPRATTMARREEDLHETCVEAADSLCLQYGAELRLGLYVRVGCGLHEFTRQLRNHTELFTALLRERFPQSPFLTIALLHDPNFGIHQDIQNAWLPNLVVELRASHGGGTWVENEEGTVALEDSNGSLRWGSILTGAYKLSARALPHCSIRGTSPRTVLVGWTSAGWKAASPQLLRELQEMGFVPPTQAQCDRARLSRWSGKRTVQKTLNFAKVTADKNLRSAPAPTRPLLWPKGTLSEITGITIPLDATPDDTDACPEARPFV